MRALFLCLMVFVLASPVSGRELAGVTMPETALVEGRVLSLSGMALRKVVFFKVYVGGMYLPGGAGDARDVLAADQPRRMVMHFLRDVGKDDMNEAWMEGLEANTPDAAPAVRDAFTALCAAMSDMAEGDTMTATYVPGAGTSVQLRGQTVAELPGKPFADALFGCWIGPKPGPGEDFREALLGG